MDLAHYSPARDTRDKLEINDPQQAKAKQHILMLNI
jgi:hypothetical protein